MSAWHIPPINKFLHPFSPLPQKLTKEVQTTLAEANKVAEETISSMRTVRSFANERGEAETYYSKLLQMFRLNKKQALAYACYMWSSYVSVSRDRKCQSFPVCSRLPLQHRFGVFPALTTGFGSGCRLLRWPSCYLQSDDQWGLDSFFHICA